MERILILLVLSLGSAPGQVANVQVQATNTQALISYTAPDTTACALELSEDASYTPLVHDVNPTLFAGADQDSRAGNLAQGRARVFVAGRRATEYGADQRAFSRALAANTLHHYRLTCGASAAAGTFVTKNLAAGGSYADPPWPDAARPGEVIWPTLIEQGPSAKVDTADVAVTWVSAEQFDTTWKPGAELKIGEQTFYLENVASATSLTVARMLGVGTLTSSGTAVTGSAAYFRAFVAPGNSITADGQVRTVVSVGNDTALVVDAAFSPPLAGHAFTIGPGSQSGADLIYMARNIRYVDPETGVVVRRLNAQREMRQATASGAFASVGTGTGWTTPAAALGDDNQYAGYAGTARQWLQLKMPIVTAAFNDTWDYFNATLRAFSDTEGTLLDVCLSTDGVTCESAIQQLALTTTETAHTICGAGAPCPFTRKAGDTWTVGYQIMARRATPAVGTLSNSGLSGVFTLSDAAQCQRLAAGDEITVTPIGWGPALFTIASVSCPSVTVSPAANLSGTNYPFQIASGLRRNSRLSLLLRKNSTTSGAGIFVDHGSFEYGTALRGATTSGGMHEVCSPAKSGNGYYRCILNTADTAWTPLYGIKPETGDARFLGSINVNGGAWGLQNGVIACQTLGIGTKTWDETDPDVFYCSHFDSSGRPILVKLTYAGNDAPVMTRDNDSGGGNFPMAPIASVVNLTVFPNDVNSQIAAAYPGFDTTRFACGWLGAAQAGYLIVPCLRSGQDSYGKIAVFKLNPGKTAATLHAATATYDKPGCRWCTFHTYQTLGHTPVAFWDVQLMGGQGGSTPGYGPYKTRVNMPSGIPNQGVNTTITVTSAWNTDWGSQPAGWAAGEPLSDTLDHFLQTAAVGDVFRIENEYVKLVQKNSATSWVVSRGAGSGQALTSAPAFHANNAELLAQCSQGAGAGVSNPWYGVAWDFVNSPDGSSATYLRGVFSNGVGHGSSRTFADGAASGLRIQSKWQGVLGAMTDPANWNKAPSFIYTDPLFAGRLAPLAGNTYQSHPSNHQAPYSETGRYLIYDINPFSGGNLISAQNSSATCQACGAYTLAGDLWRFNYAELGGDGLNRKHYATAGLSGTRALRDVSAPGSVISGNSGDAFKMCIAQVAGECVPASAAGEIFANVPGLEPNYRYCSFGEVLAGGRDVCVLDFGAYGMGVLEMRAPAEAFGSAATVIDASWRRQRVLSRMFVKWRSTLPFANAKPIPDGSWLIDDPLTESFGALLLRRVPPYPALDSVNHGTFVPVRVQIGSVPVGTTNVVVEFGYAEHGSADAFRCTSRAEKCIAHKAALDESAPFSWPVEGAGGIESGISGVSCSSACTVTIPGLTGRVVYYRVKYRDGGNAPVGASEMAAAVVP